MLRGDDEQGGVPHANFRNDVLDDVAVLNNLDAILSVPGIDLYSIGPNDFAQNLGYSGQPDHPEVVKTMQESHVASDRLGVGCNWT